MPHTEPENAENGKRPDYERRAGCERVLDSKVKEEPEEFGINVENL